MPNFSFIVLSYRFSNEVRINYSNFTDEFKATSIHNKKRENIFFLKAHKCGSSTVQNIILRYGRENHLLFVLPWKENYIGHPKIFESSLIAENLRSEDNKYNVLTHHIRYNSTEVKKVMKPNAAFVTILRDPGTLFESMFNFYRLNIRLNTSLEEILADPDRYKDSLYYRRGYRYGANQMSFDLGLSELDGNITEKIDNFIYSIEQDFDLVMISEHMEASLILLSDLMGWSLDKVVFLDSNVRQPNSKTNLTVEEKQKLRSVNQVDTKLYNHFFKIFKAKVEAYGVERMKQQVDKLINMNFDFYQKCVDQVSTRGYAKTFSYDIKKGAPLKCFFLAQQELHFTQQLRKEQIYRLAQLRKLDTLMSQKS